ncbi:MAG: DNA polymerase III subunit delta' [Burkholderiaceae bacterium]
MLGESSTETPHLPWLHAPLRAALATQRAHAILVYGPEGVGQFEFASMLAQSWLCETTDRNPAEAFALPACGVCASCRLVRARSHPDLLVLVPDALREALGWGEPESAATEKAGKAKPSKEIRIDALRGAIQFAQSTASRRRAKVVVIHPADRMNAVAANGLLKTLEEPPGIARFVLATGDPQALPPTVRSRCQAVHLGVPETALALHWLEAQGVAHAAVLLAASGGQPLLALEGAREGVDAALWARIPELMQRGDAAAFTGWPLPRLIDALQKLCHDAMCVACGAAPRYFAPDLVPAQTGVDALTAWGKSLRDLARRAEHPWNAGLIGEALVQQAQQALSSKRPSLRYTSAP